MRIDRNLLGWGVFFLVAGSIPLAIRGGVLPSAIVDRWWSFWPLILVGVGLGLILSRTWLEALGGLIVSATIGLMVGGAFAAGFLGFGNLTDGVCAGDRSGGGVPFAPQTGQFGPRAAVHLELDCGELAVTTGSDGWLVKGVDDDGAGPRVQAATDRLDVRPRSDSGGPFLRHRERVEVELPTTSTLDLNLDLNAGSLAVDLGGATVGAFALHVNAGDARVHLDTLAALSDLDVGVNAGNVRLFLPSVATRGSVRVNAGNVDLCAPAGVALRLHTGESVIASYDYAGAGLVQQGSTWETPGFDTAAVRIELETQANAGSFGLNREACRS
jgi:hypothetical protein